jgi:hypothetical protein
MAVMGSDKIIAGSNPSTLLPKTMITKNPASSSGMSARRSETAAGEPARYCGAMSQQRTDSGMTSTPQKLLHLVGCRDPKARPGR